LQLLITHKQVVK